MAWDTSSAVSFIETSSSSPTDKMIGSDSLYSCSTQIISRARSREYINWRRGFPEPQTVSGLPEKKHDYWYYNAPARKYFKCFVFSWFFLHVTNSLTRFRSAIHLELACTQLRKFERPNWATCFFAGRKSPISFRCRDLIKVSTKLRNEIQLFEESDICTIFCHFKGSLLEQQESSRGRYAVQAWFRALVPNLWFCYRETSVN